MNKPVKDRENWEHHFLIKMKYKDNVIDYVKSKEDDEFEKLIKTKLKLIEKQKTKDLNT